VLLASEATPKWPSRAGIAEFHDQVFAKHGAGPVFGGRTWDNIPGANRAYNWCPICK
jgi:hypothetical protein